MSSRHSETRRGAARTSSTFHMLNEGCDEVRLGLSRRRRSSAPVADCHVGRSALPCRVTPPSGLQSGGCRRRIWCRFVPDICEARYAEHKSEHRRDRRRRRDPPRPRVPHGGVEAGELVAAPGTRASFALSCAASVRASNARRARSTGGSAVGWSRCFRYWRWYSTRTSPEAHGYGALHRGQSSRHSRCPNTPRGTPEIRPRGAAIGPSTLYLGPS